MSTSPRDSSCVQLCLTTSRRTTIEPADTAPMATSARKRLRNNEPLNGVSVVGGQDQNSFFGLEYTAVQPLPTLRSQLGSNI